MPPLRSRHRALHHVNRRLHAGVHFKLENALPQQHPLAMHHLAAFPGGILKELRALSENNGSPPELPRLAQELEEQGIIVRQDDANWLRLEFYSRAPDQIFMLAGLPDDSLPVNEAMVGFSAVTSPMYMRVQRVGDTWTQSYSADGLSWIDRSFNYTMNVTAWRRRAS